MRVHPEAAVPMKEEDFSLHAIFVLFYSLCFTVHDLSAGGNLSCIHVDTQLSVLGLLLSIHYFSMLFVFVSAAFISLLDNYESDTGEPEIVTPEEVAENHKFLDAIIKTPTMKVPVGTSSLTAALRSSFLLKNSWECIFSCSPENPPGRSISAKKRKCFIATTAEQECRSQTSSSLQLVI